MNLPIASLRFRSMPSSHSLARQNIPFSLFCTSSAPPISHMKRFLMRHIICAMHLCVRLSGNTDAYGLYPSTTLIPIHVPTTLFRTLGG